MKKLLLFLASFLISISVLSKEISLVCETKGQAYFPNSESINLKDNAVYYLDEEKQSLHIDSTISLCNLQKLYGVFTESILINKKNIYYQCKVSKMNNIAIVEHEESVKINRISGAIMTYSSSINDEGVKSSHTLTGFCQKSSAKF